MKPMLTYRSPHWVVDWQGHEYKFRDPDLAWRFARVCSYGAMAEVP